MVEDTEAEFAQPEPVAPPKPQTVKTESLQPNPHNPRQLFDEEPLKTLQASIRKVGILVPLTVYKARGSNNYTILDGQRRWICAQRLELVEVPINEVTEPSLAQNIITMFQIHKLRKDWELMPTALKLGVLMHELKETSNDTLADLTGLDSAVVVRCKKLLWFDREYQNRMLDPDPDKRLTADLFIEMYPIVTDRSVKTATWFNKRRMIDAFIRKYLEHTSGFRAVTDFRKIKAYLTAARKAGRETEILKRLGELIESDEVTIADLEIEAARIHRDAETLSRRVAKLRDDLAELDVDAFAAEEDLWRQLEELLVAIRHKLAEGERRAV